MRSHYGFVKNKNMVKKRDTRLKRIYWVTLKGSLVNVLLLTGKFVAGILGGSAAMIADAVHSLSDFVNDIVILLFVKLGSKPMDKDHDYGHGKYETLATAVIGVSLLAVGVMIFIDGVRKVWDVMQGQTIESPGIIALVAAVASIILKEWAFRFTMKVGKEVDSQAVIANAWDHRSDALSSIGTALGIGGAILLGSKWAVLDPLAALVVSIFILKAAYTLVIQATNELLEASLSEHIEQEIMDIALQEENVTDPHNLRTRSIGNIIAIEMHVRMPGNISLYEAHRKSTNIENRLKERFGEQTHVGIHPEPIKVNGRYIEPQK